MEQTGWKKNVHEREWKEGEMISFADSGDLWKASKGKLSEENEQNFNQWKSERGEEISEKMI